MAKALLQQKTQEVLAARKNSQEKAAANNTSSTPIPIPKPNYTPTPSPTPSPTFTPIIQQVVVHSSRDNDALLKEKAEKERAQQLYQAEKIAREKSQEQHKEELTRIQQMGKVQLQEEQTARIKAEELQQEELTRNKQLVRDDDSLKRRHDIALEKVKSDKEIIERLTAENEALKQEIEMLKKVGEENKLPNETLPQEEDNKAENIPPVPPPYDEPSPGIHLPVANNDVPLTGEVEPTTPVDDGSNDKCIVS